MTDNNFEKSMEQSLESANEVRSQNRERSAEVYLEETVESGFKLFDSVQESLKNSTELQSTQREHALSLIEQLDRGREMAESNTDKEERHMEAMQHHLWMHFAHFLHSVAEAVLGVIEIQQKLKELEEQEEHQQEAKMHRAELHSKERELLVLLAEAKAKHHLAETHLFHFHETPAAKAHEGFASTIYPRMRPIPPSGKSHGAKQQTQGRQQTEWE